MRVLGIVQYKGTNYQGWQKQRDVLTIQEVIEKILSKILDQEINIFGSGRTDAGVHAKAQTFHFDCDKEFDLEKLTYAMNRLLPEDIKILSLKEVDKDFHARFSIKKKTYEYHVILNQKEPFSHDLEYVYPFKVDKKLIKQSIKEFVGKHDFKDYTSKEEDEDNFIREIYSTKAIIKNNKISLIFTGNGFMRYQIRYMVGVILAVASKQQDISYLIKHLDSKNQRDIVNYKAPSEGLYLLEVCY